MSDTGPPGIGVTTSATAGGALRRRDRRLRGHAADPPRAHQQNLRFSNELNRPVSPAPSVSSNSSEFSEATMAEVEAALRNHNPYNYDKWPEWKLAGDLGGVPYWLSVYSRYRSPGWQFRAEDDDVFLEQREPSDDEEDIFAKQRDPYVNEEYRVAYDDSKMRQCITRSRHASPTMHPPPPSPPPDPSRSLCPRRSFLCEAAFAIVGVGRQPAPGCSNIENDITLNLALIKGVEIKEGYVSIDAGENCGSVFEKLEEKGLACAGSRSGKGGFAGLALSGGLSFFSSRDGFICDDVVNYEVVFASGSIINANKNQNSDLFVVLRGGDNNFGVVTRFHMRTFNQGPLSGGSIYYTGSHFHDQAKALVHELQKPDANLHTHLMVKIGFAAAFGNSLGLTPDGGAIVSTALLAYWVNPSDDEKILGSLKTVLEKLDENATACGTAVPFKYLNYSFGFQDPIGSYGAENKARLQEAGKEYDPKGIFQKGVPGGWELFP
ncbi:hypothetical protein NUW58_g2708 [Xylaria curta]|uniref:Uncharacterized protein n=1 Tax=Xylaria curta TaxID=42375 RepID=A0ACC1PG11_9PEZI|nr:hypothetical protein NUW58_g2708 [Xylaria curta]